ncbi:MAG: response regulator [Legionellales bacterium]|nr:response regulator [Legionellales bacterium]
MISVLVIEEQELIKQGLVRLLNDANGIDVTGSSSSIEGALNAARTIKPDVALLDLTISSSGGLETIRRMVRVSPDTRIVVLSNMCNHPFPYRTMQVGASGFITKDSTADDLEQAIKKVHAGQKYISTEIAQQMALKSVSDEPEDASPFDSLSPRELQVMIMITNGLKVQDISEKLYLSPKTVNSYRYRLFNKLKIRSDVELTHFAISHGLIEVTSYGIKQLENEPEKMVEVPLE